ncbi:helix-turn-helix transcriptional regulator [Bacillus sp. 3255]|uniref:helix-turn-helix domain-containing protein n=1 Tax=Bacillus sp. 3255 TaxID=2817904 RepID=UPI00285A227B|nr:helix-turn-helix transcriptional regulator [Bacillus sp. 3255]MDR6880388.1 transcriptional regulator with XRE-family HTH domain [Bacillus sp. 3255]
MEFSNRLKYLRNQKNMTQEQLGQKINVTKVSISGYENSNRTPDMETLQKIADFFEVSVDYLLGRSETTTSEGVGRAFFGGADHYTEEELEIARAAAQAAVEAYRKGLNKKK